MLSTGATGCGDGLVGVAVTCGVVAVWSRVEAAAVARWSSP
ncbi:hypothetical protein HSB1_45280 [Halogranum salarium B-1]|uniref:Uncharacterized protein n=1 Tax=Halogranum salarium B-1 TaxID=1210908 RepID=J3ESZ6_9EURY|nr:hypothetical protein HSB1_45280 [Halogranum salarium B-1]